MATAKDMVAVAKHAITHGATVFARSEFDAAIEQRAKELGRSWAFTAEHDEVGKLLMRAQRYASDSPLAGVYTEKARDSALRPAKVTAEDRRRAAQLRGDQKEDLDDDDKNGEDTIAALNEKAAELR